MQCYINTVSLFKGKAQLSRVFGYATKGLPGVEIVGFKGKNKILKEKIIYLTKIFKIKIPLKRFVICLDGNESDSHLENIQEFELPVLLLLLALSNNLRILDLQNCLSLGAFESSGDLMQSKIPDEVLKNIMDKKFTLIGSYQVQPNQGVRLISFSYVSDSIKEQVT